MKYQTFTSKEKDIDIELFKNTLSKVYQKYGGKVATSYNVYSEKFGHQTYASFDFPNNGGVFFSSFWDSFINLGGIKCQAVSNYLGFRDTKNFNKMLSNVESSLEDIFYVHTGTGEIK